MRAFPGNRVCALRFPESPVMRQTTTTTRATPDKPTPEGSSERLSLRQADQARADLYAIHDERRTRNHPPTTRPVADATGDRAHRRDRRPRRRGACRCGRRAIWPRLMNVGRSQQGRDFGGCRPCLRRRARAELLAVLPHDRRRWFRPDADGTPVIDEGALGGNSFVPDELR